MEFLRKKRKILLVGNWRWDIYEEAMAMGFSRAGWVVDTFRTLDYLPKGWVFTQLQRLKTKWLVSRLNQALISKVETCQPDVIFIIRTEEILPETLHCLRSAFPGIFIVSYHNDNPFQGKLRRFVMRYFLHNLKIVDLVLVYRPSNIQSALTYGARRVEVFPPSYISNRHYPRSGGKRTMSSTSVTMNQMAGRMSSKICLMLASK